MAKTEASSAHVGLDAGPTWKLWSVFAARGSVPGVSFPGQGRLPDAISIPAGDALELPDPSLENREQSRAACWERTGTVACSDKPLAGGDDLVSSAAT